MKTILLLCLLATTATHAQTKPAQMETDGAYYSPKDKPAAPHKSIPVVGEESTEPFKGATIILLHTPDSANVALKKIGRLLVVAGYTLERMDLDLGYLSTAGKPAGSILTPATYNYKIIALSGPAGTTLKITGSYTVSMGIRTSLSSSMVSLPSQNQPATCFLDINKIAVTYPGARIGYTSDGVPRSLIHDSTKQF